MEIKTFLENCLDKSDLTKSGIYSIYCIISDKIYIGKAHNFRNRFKYHKQKLKKNQHENPHLQNAWNLYGELAFKFFVVEYCDKNEAPKKELGYISLFDKNQRYNIYLCEGCIEIPKETREKISASLKGIKRSDEFKERMRKASVEREAKRRELGLKKKPISDIHRAKLKIASTGRAHSEKTKLVIGENSRGRKDSEETKLNKSEAQNKRQLLIRENKAKLVVEVVND